jgi:hypothetical protein
MFSDALLGANHVRALINTPLVQSEERVGEKRTEDESVDKRAQNDAEKENKQNILLPLFQSKRPLWFSGI